jgi:hypothetical protein
MILKIISYLVISCYVLTLFFIHTTSTCIVRFDEIHEILIFKHKTIIILDNRSKKSLKIPKGVIRSHKLNKDRQFDWEPYYDP